MIAVCADEVQPEAGAAFSACTEVIWEVPPSIVPELSTEAALQLSGAVILLWAVCYGGVVLRRAMRY